MCLCFYVVRKAQSYSIVQECDASKVQLLISSLAHKISYTKSINENGISNS